MSWSDPEKLKTNSRTSVDSNRLVANTSDAYMPDTMPDHKQAVAEQIAAMSPEEFQAMEKQLLWKMDLKLIPWMTYVTFHRQGVLDWPRSLIRLLYLVNSKLLCEGLMDANSLPAEFHRSCQCRCRKACRCVLFTASLETCKLIGPQEWPNNSILLPCNTPTHLWVSSLVLISILLLTFG